MGSPQKIAAAVTATEQVQEEVLKAFNALTGFASHINACGVFTDCFHPRVALAAAREAIERAEQIMCDTAWPVPEDYAGA
ncbi:hypothetical protein [Microvirga massiliensis]|uniref:hypothetical protein n=1 Tax=Microvirga massiliensis TaxID=1033741 RepID=UPI00062B5C7F|nr:hypothetical protein [Microvirga massiliensis]